MMIVIDLSFNQRNPLKSSYFASYGYIGIMVFNKVQWTMFGETMQYSLAEHFFLTLTGFNHATSHFKPFLDTFKANAIQLPNHKLKCN